MKSLSWKEKDFEKWFTKHPSLPSNEPSGETILVIKKERDWEKVVDLLAIDVNGELVFLEIKNEPVVREVIGQLLEYMADYCDVDLEALENTYREQEGVSLSVAFEKCFGKPITRVMKGRRAFVVGPSFKPESAACVKYLQDLLGHAHVHVGLLAAEKTQGGFVLKVAPPPSYITAEKMSRHEFALSPSRALYCCLEASAGKRVFWRIGHLDEKGRLTSQQVKSRILRGFITKKLMKISKDKSPQDVDLSMMGKVFQKGEKKEKRGQAIGVLTRSKRKWIVIARYEDGHFDRIQTKELSLFENEWHETKESPRPWSEILGEVLQSKEK